ncbi:hypothetical protein BESB_054170 [Besnoitia besnoiti]|uniref:Protein kinase domain-containing protein n=1 Tax=Besnoitia besnoiti TaxID=94643 RepID=A0A2A9MIH5_BESBE|nr:hypothetical protein BESB_054170 [Besnoitia besnoiti]PFH35766.1 hypothetical protein BESB_054170 [Besnoitia besnoiti]
MASPSFRVAPEAAGSGASLGSTKLLPSPLHADHDLLASKKAQALFNSQKSTASALGISTRSTALYSSDSGALNNSANSLNSSTGFDSTGVQSLTCSNAVAPTLQAGIMVEPNVADAPVTPTRAAAANHGATMVTPTNQRDGNDKSASQGVWCSCSGSESGVEDGTASHEGGMFRHGGSASAHQKRFRAQTRNASSSSRSAGVSMRSQANLAEVNGPLLVRGLLAAAGASQSNSSSGVWTSGLNAPDNRLLSYSGASASALNSGIAQDPRLFLHAKTPESLCKSAGSPQPLSGAASTRIGTHLTTPGSCQHRVDNLGLPADSTVGAVRRALDQWFGVSSSGSDCANASVPILGNARSHRLTEAMMAAGGVGLGIPDPGANCGSSTPFLGGSNPIRGTDRAAASAAPSVVGAGSATSVSCRSFCRGASCDTTKKSTDPAKQSTGTSQAKASDVSLSGLSSSQGATPSAKRSSHKTIGPKVAAESIVPVAEGTSNLAVYRGPDPLPTCLYRRLYDPMGPVMFSFPPLQGAQHPRAEIRLWPRDVDRVISQNSSKRKVHRAVWLSPVEPKVAFPVALKFVEDGNIRDGRSIKREIECHLYIYQRLAQLMQGKTYNRLEDAWPCAEMFGYYLDKKNPGMSVLVTRKLSGPDFFDVIRTEHTSTFNARTAVLYEQHKLQWCLLAMERIAQYSRLSIRHNDIKPDNIVLDFYAAPDSNERLLDVKLIDLGTASMQHAKDFTGGTSWYESPEQKVLEYHTKKQRNLEAAKQVDIGLPSDAWGAGLSITEVLMGRRVVDVMKPPLGPGPLDFRGAEGWAVEPKDWVRCARQALGLDREHQRFPLCAEAARLVFSMLVRPKPAMRATVEDVLPHLRLFADEATFQAIRKYHDPTATAKSASNPCNFLVSPRSLVRLD